MTQIIFGLLMVLIGMAAFIVARRARSSMLLAAKTDTSVVTMISWGGAALSVLGAILLFVSGFVVVDAGHRGVVVLFGNVSEHTLEEGFHVVNPLSSVRQMSARVEKDEEVHPAETSDTQSVTVKIITNWRPRGTALGDLYKNYGSDYATKIIPPAVREAVKAEVAKYKVTELIAKRPEIHQNVQATINTWLNKYGLEVLEVAIADIDFSDKYDAAIEAKQVQEQQALQKEYELKKTVTEAQMAAAVAKGESDSRIARAMGEAESVKMSATAEAEALRLRGEAQADYNKKVAESLSPLLIQNEWLKRWNGQLPTYNMSGGSPLFMMPAPAEKK